MKKQNIFYDASLIKRHRQDKIFKIVAMSAIVISLLFLFLFLSDMIIKGSSALKQTYIQIPITYNENTISHTRKSIERKYRKLISRSAIRNIPKDVKQNPSLLNTTTLQWVLADDQVDMYMKSYYYKIKKRDLKVLKKLIKEDRVQKRFNTIFFTNGDSKMPEYSGILSSMIGTIMTLFVTMIVAFPIGIFTAIYLEEFSNQNSKISHIIEININNLAAIPSILFGLLGLSIFINFFGMPRSSALVGGLTLALMTLPIIIVSSRAALRSVPASIAQAGYGLGLTKVQVVKDHIIPLAFPGIMTGSIIGLANAIGESAPLIIVGMIAFIPDISTSIMDSATVMPAQIFTWANMPERAYIERTAAGILVLLSVLVFLNALAIYLRKKFEIKW
jgi:phosphate transport system permease protein